MYPQDIRMHCSFPGTIFTETFYDEQKSKPALTKELEGSDDPRDGMTPKAVARAIFDGLGRDDYLIPVDFQTRMLLNNMRGPSPSDRPLLDWVLGFVASLTWPLFRTSMDRKIRAHQAGQR